MTTTPTFAPPAPGLTNDEVEALAELTNRAIDDENTYFQEGWPAQDHGDEWLPFLEARLAHWTNILAITKKLGRTGWVVQKHIDEIARKIDAAKQ